MSKQSVSQSSYQIGDIVLLKRPSWLYRIPEPLRAMIPKRFRRPLLSRIARGNDPFDIKASFDTSSEFYFAFLNYVDATRGDSDYPNSTYRGDRLLLLVNVDNPYGLFAHALSKKKLKRSWSSSPLPPQIKQVDEPSCGLAEDYIVAPIAYNIVKTEWIEKKIGCVSIDFLNQLSANWKR